MDNEWKHSLNDKMKDYEEPAPEGLWAAISESDDFGRLVPGRKSAGRRRLWFAVSGAMAAVFALFMLLWHPEDGAVGEGQDLLAVVSPVIPGVSDESVADADNMSAQAAGLPLPPSASSGITEKESIGQTEGKSPDMTGKDVLSVIPGVSEESVADANDNMSSQTADVPLPPSASSGITEKESIGQTEGKSSDMTGKESFDMTEWAGQDGKTAGKRWSAGLLAANIPTSSSSSRPGETVFARPVQSNNSVDFVANSLSDVRTFNTTRETVTSYTHYQPVKVGVSVRYNISRNWSVESGLTYSYLYSKIRSGSDDYYETGAQSLHYLGLPLNFNFNIWSGRSLSLYASAGGLMEKCVAGKISSTSYFKETKGETRYEDVMVKQLQWSAAASLGLQYDISGLLGIYIEPGAAYYFNNGSTVETFYGKHPFNFNLELGLRFSF